MIDSLLGAPLGAVCGGLVSWFLTKWQMRREKSDRLAQGQFDLLRRLVRHKDGTELAAALNEVPVLFAHDKEALDRYEWAVPKGANKADMVAVARLLEHLARKQGLPVDGETLLRGFVASVPSYGDPTVSRDSTVF